MRTRSEIKAIVTNYAQQHGEEAADTILLLGHEIDSVPDTQFAYIEAMAQVDPATATLNAKHEAGKLVQPRTLDELAQQIWAQRNGIEKPKDELAPVPADDKPLDRMAADIWAKRNAKK